MLVRCVLSVAFIWRTVVGDQTPCGVPSAPLGPSNRIIGGWQTTVESFPWHVMVLVRDGVLKIAHECGGALVEKTGFQNGTDVVLSAAHCFFESGSDKGFVASEVAVRYGMTNKKLDQSQELFTHASDVVVSPDFDQSTLQGDLIVIKLAKFILYGPKFRPACLPPAKTVAVGLKCFTAGWGTTSASAEGHFPDTLHATELKVVDVKLCGEHAPKDKSQLCLVSADGSSSCEGDSGGAVVCKHNGKYAVYGIISHGDDECKVNIATSVPHYINFVKDSIS